MRKLYRRLRLRIKALLGRDVWLPVERKLPIEHHGSESCGWPVLADSLNAASIIYSFGVGEDASFDVSLIRKYGCRVLAFDPTPKSLDYVRRTIGDPLFIIHPTALADHVGTLELFLPTNAEHVSASLEMTDRTKGASFLAECATLGEIMCRNGHDHIDVLKVDIEGAEYSAFGAGEGLDNLRRTHQLLIEFHHWMEPFSVRDTLGLCERLKAIGFRVAWTSPLGHEVLFVNSNWKQ
ncbi:MAG: hypothetical protein RLZZ179_15 [Verrucomicrobiota bacterium]